MQIASGDLSDSESRPRGNGSSSSPFPFFLSEPIRLPGNRLLPSIHFLVRSRRQEIRKESRHVTLDDVVMTRLHGIQINADSSRSFAKRSDGWRNARNSLLTMVSEQRIIRASPDGLQYL